MEQFLERLKFVTAKDIASVFLMAIGFICSLFYRFYRKDFWLICERRNEARDNGYCFFEYMIKEHPEQDVIYAIDKNSKDFAKVAALGKTVQFGSLMHWICYFSAKKNISSQKEGKPNAAICFVLEVYFNLIRNRVYIRHGITKDDQRWVYYDVSKIQLFSCAVEREYVYIKEKFGYPKNSVQLLGLCRFDKLIDQSDKKKQILVMPTWREWLGRISSDTLKIENTDDVSQMNYFVKWNSFLNNEKLGELLELNDYQLIFYPHSSVQKYTGILKSKLANVRIVTGDEQNIQKLLKESRVLITDYSSVFFDFAYMKKPVIYYQFDYDVYRSEHYKEGYFSYTKDGFGPVAYLESDVIENLEQYIYEDDAFAMYFERMDKFFTYHDTDNCKRTYEAIKKWQIK